MSVGKILDKIDKRDIIELLSDLVSMPSYDSEQRVVEYIAQRLDEINVEYEITEVAPARQNLTAFTGAGERSLIFNSHIDTVPPGNTENWKTPPLELTRSGDYLFGLGACDAKGSLAGMITAFELLARNSHLLAGRLILQAVCCEETHARGTLAEVERGITADAAIIGEPTSLVPMIGHKGALRLYITIFGKAAHGSAPQEGVNAISKMAVMVQALDALAKDIFQRRDPLFENASLAVTEINGGEAPNVIPDKCVIALDRRLIPGAKLNGHREQRLSNTLNLTLPGIRGESLVLALDQKGVAASSGSACHAGQPEPSRALVAMGLSHDEAHCAVRFSLGIGNTADEIDSTLSSIEQIVHESQDVIRFVACR